MNTTAFGLMFGIPLMIFHTFIVNMTGSVVDMLEMASIRTISLITRTAKRNNTDKAAA